MQLHQAPDKYEVRGGGFQRGASALRSSLGLALRHLLQSEAMVEGIKFRVNASKANMREASGAEKSEVAASAAPGNTSCRCGTPAVFSSGALICQVQVWTQTLPPYSFVALKTADQAAALLAQAHYGTP